MLNVYSKLWNIIIRLFYLLILTYAGIGGVEVPFWYWDDDAGVANGSNPWNMLADDCDDDDDDIAEDWARLYKSTHLHTTSKKKIIWAENKRY